MPPTRATQNERMVKRVDNAIHNSSVDYRSVKSALADLKAAGIPVYREDYDHWIRLAIDACNEIKLRCLFGSIKTSSLAHLLKKSPAHIPLYVKSPMYRSHYEYHYHDIMEFVDEELPGYEKTLTLFFQQQKSWPVLQKLLFQKYYMRFLRVNPVAKKRKHLATVLLRFWLLTTKPLLRVWRESLYAPGTGALYLKALASFESDRHD
jgi:hypothetical protein